MNKLESKLSTEWPHGPEECIQPHCVCHVRQYPKLPPAATPEPARRIGHDPKKPWTWYLPCRWCGDVIHWMKAGYWTHVAEYGVEGGKLCGVGKHEAEPKPEPPSEASVEGETEQWKSCPVDCMLKRDADSWIAATRDSDYQRGIADGRRQGIEQSARILDEAGEIGWAQGIRDVADGEGE